MLVQRGLVQFGAGEQSWHDEVPQEVIGESDHGFPDLAQLQSNPWFQLLVEDVDRVVLVDF